MEKAFLVQMVVQHVDGSKVVRSLAVFVHREDADQFIGKRTSSLVQTGLAARGPNGSDRVVAPTKELLLQLGISGFDLRVSEVEIHGSMLEAPKSGIVLPS